MDLFGVKAKVISVLRTLFAIVSGQIYCEVKAEHFKVRLMSSRWDCATLKGENQFQSEINTHLFNRK